MPRVEIEPGSHWCGGAISDKLGDTCLSWFHSMAVLQVDQPRYLIVDRSRLFQVLDLALLLLISNLYHLTSIIHLPSSFNSHKNLQILFFGCIATLPPGLPTLYVSIADFTVAVFFVEYFYIFAALTAWFAIV